MKKLIVIFMSLLLLCGCAAKEQQDATAATDDAQAPTQEALVSLYDADSEVEKNTSGAVRAYPLGDGIFAGLASMNERLLVISTSGDITLLQSELGQIVATKATELMGTENGLPLWTFDQGASYYVPESNEIRMLNADLLETAKIPLPEDMVGEPVVLLQRNEVFYCTVDQIRAMDIQTGISRLVRSHSCTEQSLIGGYFNDTVIGCRVVDEQKGERILYLSAETGEMIQEDSTLGELHTNGAEYFATRKDGEQTQVLFGSADTETMCLEIEADGLIPALPLGGVVQCRAGEDGVTLTFYEFASGTRKAEVMLPGIVEPIAMAADHEAFWFVVDQMLYRWDPSASLTGDNTNHAIQLYTAKNPDAKGLEMCQKRVDEIKTAYGIDLRIWTDALVDNESYVCQPEYRVSFLDEALTELEGLLKLMPEGFLATTGNIRVSLVHSLEGGQPVQYWKEGNGNTFCMIIPTEMAGDGFLWGLGFAVDTRLWGHSRKLDTWKDLNPKSFEYTYDYEANALREDAQKYEGDFVDLVAMSFPTEDRARTFRAAIQPGNEELFANETLQDKLIRLCKGIREAYNAEDVTDIFPWEQYLEKPIAAKKD